MQNQTSFKEFLNSKEALLKAVNGPPVCTREYAIDRYVRLPITEDGQRAEISLKPKNVIKVKWLYESAENPIALRITLNETQIKTNFSGKKLHDWLTKYSRNK